MAQDHHKTGAGRYYKDEPSRRSRKHYGSNHGYNNNHSHSHNYSLYSSYSSNPNPFPSPNQAQAHPQTETQAQAKVQSQPHSHTQNGPAELSQKSHPPSSNQSQMNPFSSRRNDTAIANSLNASTSEFGSNSRSSANDSWYHSLNSKRPSVYHSTRPTANPNMNNSSNTSRKNSYRDDSNSKQSQRYSDYNNYISSYSHYPNNSSHNAGKKSYGKSKYYSSLTAGNSKIPPISKGSSDHRDYSNGQPTPLPNSASNPSKKESLTSKPNTFGNQTESVNLKKSDSDNSNVDLTFDIKNNDNPVSEPVKQKEIQKGDGIEQVTNHNITELPPVNDPREKVLGDLDNYKDDTKVDTKDQIKDKSESSQNNDIALSTNIKVKEENTISNSPVGKSDEIETRPTTIEEKEPKILILNKDTSPAFPNAVTVQNELIKIENPEINEKKRSEAIAPLVKSVTAPIEESEDENSDVEGYIFPMLKSQYRAWDLKHDAKSKRRRNLKYLNKSKLRNLKQYNFLDKSLLIFKQADAFLLFNSLKEINCLIGTKKTKLTNQFVYSNYLWQKDISLFEKQLEKAYENDNENTLKVEEKQPPKSTSTRRSRHHGDSVRTEAEFMEILASLEQERERDPLIRAQYGAALIPDMMMDPVEKYSLTRKMNSNNLIKDKNEWAKRILTDPIDTFTEAEHNKFCELYTLHPKKFGKISHDMGGLRTSEECVLHYYKTKKSTNYKQMIANKNKRSKKKAQKKKSKDSKSRNETTTPDTSNVEPESTTIAKNDETINSSNNNKRKASFDEGAAIKLRKVVVTNEPNATDSAIIETEIETETEATKTVETSRETEDPKIEESSKEAEILDTSAAQTVRHSDAFEHRSEDSFDDKKSKKAKKKDDEKHHISSYWSVQDINKFPELLQSYGSDWEQIANRMDTKTSTMVKNYYQRGLVEHPEWQLFIKSQMESKHNDLLSDENHSRHANPIYMPTQQPQPPSDGPSMGYFYKPSNTFSTTYPKVSAMPQYIQPRPSPDDCRTMNYLPKFVPVNQPAPVYKPYTGQAYPQMNVPSSSSMQQQPVPIPNPIQNIVPLHQHRNNVMNMSSLLNANNSPPMVQPSLLPPLNIQYNYNQAQSSIPSVTPAINLPSTSQPIRHPNLMNLLNTDDNSTNHKLNGEAGKTFTTSFKPNINNIMNEAPVKSFQHNPTQSVPYATTSVIYNQSQQPQQQQPQQQQQPHPSSSQQPRSAFSGGTSALDALARIAFERK